MNDAFRRGTKSWLKRLMAVISKQARPDGEHQVWTGEVDDQGEPVFERFCRRYAVRRVVYDAYHGLVYWDEVPVPTCGNSLCVAPEHTTKVPIYSAAARNRGYRETTCPRCEKKWMSPDPRNERYCPSSAEDTYSCARKAENDREASSDLFSPEERVEWERKIERLQHDLRTPREKKPKTKRDLATLCRDVSRKLSKRGDDHVATEGDPGTAGGSDRSGAEDQEPAACGGGTATGQQEGGEARSAA